MYANIISGQYTEASGIFNEYFLAQYVRAEIIAEDYIWYVVRARAVPFLAVCFLGCTKWKKVTVGGAISWTGFASGMLAVMAVLRLGMKGLVLCLAGVFPQICVYALAYLVVLFYLYRYPEGRWNTGKTVFVVLAFLTGILLETYVNPVLMKIVIKAF